MPLWLWITLAIFAALAFIGTRASESALIVRGPRRESAPRVAGEDVARETGARMEDAETTSDDGIALRGWLFTPQQWNGGAILLVHGFTDCRGTLLRHARLFLKHGWAALVIDNRGHGESDDAVVSFGVREAGDVRRWGDWLLGRLSLDRYAVFGQSMGAAITVLSLARDSRIAAAVVEACYTRFEQAALRRLVDRHLFGWRPGQWLFRPVLEYGYLYGRLRYGVDLRRSAPERVIRSTTTPVYLIHGSLDTMVPPDASRALHALNPRHTRHWEVAGAAHTECLAKEPEEYERRVTGFLSDHFFSSRRNWKTGGPSSSL